MDKITLTGDPGDLRLILRGEITVEDAAQLKDAVIETIREGRPLAVCVAELTRLDAAALQVLVAGAREAKQAVVSGAVAPAWSDAFTRYAIHDPFIPSP